MTAGLDPLSPAARHEGKLQQRVSQKMLFSIRWSLT